MRHFLLCCLLWAASCGIAQAQAIVLPPSISLDSLIQVPGVTLTQITDVMDAYADPNDSEEGGQRSGISTFKNLWTGRVGQNDSSGNNMFRQYYGALQKDIVDQKGRSCDTSIFQGSWKTIGPDSLPQQVVGKVDVLWADPDDPNYILAGTIGGLFKTTDGGLNWQCITDNAPFAAGLMGIFSIAVNPLNKNIIYLGTSSNGINNMIIPGDNDMGAAIIKTYNGGASWQQELIPRSDPFDDSSEAVQQVCFTPKQELCT